MDPHGAGSRACSRPWRSSATGPSDGPSGGGGRVPSCVAESGSSRCSSARAARGAGRSLYLSTPYRYLARARLCPEDHGDPVVGRRLLPLVADDPAGLLAIRPDVRPGRQPLLEHGPEPAAPLDRSYTGPVGEDRLNLLQCVSSARGPSLPTRHAPGLFDPRVHLRSLRLRHGRELDVAAPIRGSKRRRRVKVRAAEE